QVQSPGVGAGSRNKWSRVRPAARGRAAQDAEAAGGIAVVEEWPAEESRRPGYPKVAARGRSRLTPPSARFLGDAVTIPVSPRPVRGPFGINCSSRARTAVGGVGGGRHGSRLLLYRTPFVLAGRPSSGSAVKAPSPSRHGTPASRCTHPSALPLAHPLPAR